MEGQHPIPSQISSYEFKLVGDMTLKQFMKAAIGIIIAVLIYKTKLLAIFKWPLMFASGGLGLALAFVPFEDRPLETWVIAFLKSIYSPTIYTYKKKNEDWLDLSGAKKEEEETSQLYENKNANTVFKEDSVKNVGAISKTYSKPKKLKEKQIEVAKTIPKQDKEKRVEAIFETREKKEEVIPEEKTENINIQKNEPVDLNLKKEKLEATGVAVFGNIPMPDRPDIPNIIVGMATNNEGKIIDGVIVEIQDSHGNPIRVIKTNALGQFKISTPLANGRYLMIAEKEGHSFDRVNIDLSGKIVDPIRIIAHN